MRGRALKLSASRRLVGDLMRFSMKVPRVSVQRRMNLGPLLKARTSLESRPSWTALFLKGYALLAQESPSCGALTSNFPDRSYTNIREASLPSRMKGSTRANESCC